MTILSPQILARKRPAAPAGGLKTGLIGFWELGEASGAARADSTGNGLTLSENGPVASIAGKIGNAANFNTTSNLTKADTGLLDFTGDFTVVFWICFPSSLPAGFCVLVSKMSGGPEWRIYYSSAAIGFQVNTFNFSSQDQINHPTTITTGGTGYFVVAKRVVGGNLTININNGTAAIASTNVSLITHGAAPLDVGDVSSSLGPGWIDQLGIWTRAISSTEETTLYNGGAGLAYSGM